MNLTHWPLFGLVLRTPRLELRLPDLPELDALGELAAEGVHDPKAMPFLVPWTDAPPAERARSTIRFHWRQLAEWTPEDWSMQFAVFLDGRVVGTQSVGAREFAVVREVGTGSWLGRRFQGRGIGTEMRAAVLAFAFDGLGAETAVSAAFADNPASTAVSRRLGYECNGLNRVRVRDERRLDQRFVLDRAGWERNRKVEVETHGLGPCLPFFGL
ncbi:GNAT family N-acetyltransferase [Actinomadura algeriensis]|uniref:RimJ/RimL family protein N-acetyltransferase n=1 Tax=Actinomadura algeriensis TaxID=1679523 RepID=A0ABR9K3V2_9ACTN|nr:GNAT family N-acetyltransferase [Actinomadura algeriensis]MBE1537512.1 RimJ/RimL family protein N-acetyltransferase [Actinomadura algeriensis]